MACAAGLSAFVTLRNTAVISRQTPNWRLASGRVLHAVNVNHKIHLRVELYLIEFMVRI